MLGRAVVASARNSVSGVDLAAHGRGRSAAGSMVSSPTAPSAASAKGMALGVGVLRIVARTR